MLNVRTYVLVLIGHVALGAADWDDPSMMNAVVGVWEHPYQDSFTIGDASGSWSTAEHYAIEWRMVDMSTPRFSPWGGVHLGWDEREGTFANGGEIESHAILIGLQGGGGVHLMPERENFDPMLSIFGRGCIGFQNGSISNYAFTDRDGDPQIGEGSLSPIRYEFALGFEASLTIGRRLVVFAGTGITWFFAAQSTTVIAGSGGSAVAVSADYAGGEAWTRLGVGLTL